MAGCFHRDAIEIPLLGESFIAAVAQREDWLRIIRTAPLHPSTIYNTIRGFAFSLCAECEEEEHGG